MTVLSPRKLQRGEDLKITKTHAFWVIQKFDKLCTHKERLGSYEMTKSLERILLPRKNDKLHQQPHFFQTHLNAVAARHWQLDRPALFLTTTNYHGKR